jgi:hypothetical protein
MASNKKKSNGLGGKEAVFIVKPVAKGYGLDYIHVTLAVLVVILVGLAFALAAFKPAATVAPSCSTSNAVSNCITTPQHNSSQVLMAASEALVYYSTLNTSLSLLPYYSLMNRSRASYVPYGREWLVVVPYVSPYNSLVVYNFSMLIYDSNLSVKNAFINSVMPLVRTGKSVAGLGAVSIDTTSACNTTKPLPVYLITDPYAPGAFAAINSSIAASKKYGDSVDVSYFMVFSRFAISHYAGFSAGQTQLIGNYMYCASKQKNFPQFISNLSIAYNGDPLSNLTLTNVAQGSSLQMGDLGSCLANSSTAIDYQSELASHYNITSTPLLIVNCKYLTIPQTLDYAINYSLNST